MGSFTKYVKKNQKVLVGELVAMRVQSWAEIFYPIGMFYTGTGMLHGRYTDTLATVQGDMNGKMIWVPNVK